MTDQPHPDRKSFHRKILLEAAERRLLIIRGEVVLKATRNRHGCSERVALAKIRAWLPQYVDLTEEEIHNLSRDDLIIKAALVATDKECHWPRVMEI